MNKWIKRNRPASTLIKEYIEKKKGRMSEARAELHRRFDYLDYSQQKKILGYILIDTFLEKIYVEILIGRYFHYMNHT